MFLNINQLLGQRYPGRGSCTRARVPDLMSSEFTVGRVQTRDEK